MDKTRRLGYRISAANIRDRASGVVSAFVVGALRPLPQQSPFQWPPLDFPDADGATPESMSVSQILVEWVAEVAGAGKWGIDRLVAYCNERHGFILPLSAIG